jgi:hypothetical protein
VVKWCEYQKKSPIKGGEVLEDHIKDGKIFTLKKTGPCLNKKKKKKKRKTS